MNQNKPLYELFPDSDPLNYYGYEVQRHGNLEDFNSLKNKILSYFKESLVSFKPDLSDKLIDFAIEDYHLLLEANKIDQHEFIKSISRTLPDAFLADKFILEMVKLSERRIGKALQIFSKKIEFRIVRPNQSDNNALHRDHWFPYFKPLMNVYVPISGSFYDSAMCVVPFSHKWSDEEVKPTFTYDDIKKGVKTIGKNGIAYSVPEIKSSKKEIVIHRPDVMEGDFMLFSPWMVHGGGSNFSQKTRMSLEIRLEIQG